MTSTELQTKAITISAETLRDIATLANIASSDTARPVLTGIHVRTDGKEIVATATDSYQLGQMTYECTGDELNVLIPAAYLVRITKELGKKYHGDVVINVTHDKIHAEIGGSEYRDYLINATYPDVQRLITECQSAIGQDRTTAANEITTSLDPRLLARIAKVAPFTDKLTHANFYIGASNKAVMITGGKTVILQMPVRVR